MKRQKRDVFARAFKRGYLAGVSGKSKDRCPSDQAEVRQEWLNGWREGRTDHWDGMTGVSGIHRLADVTAST
ncbi:MULTISPECIES: ribosome modulation factor [Marinobacter]|uniref:Ribosome modulation factor n=1 Tax=Marinobacter xestospongiae TaxID=994319 RepID=A0ABU3W2F0_9GAMM|nr:MULTISPECIES: ribosome modulation factor [Marinobacter]MCG8519466.1 ribosome modulation factor [Pseudomonadales bacterium]MCK7566856.1 ribosome modulation factor [Marinobacter xestospongiae]MDV2080711.1 ribosome modulation factor [Marinobacter xestospongiae]UDL03620.1 ribosome modulation factor [Marinobacter sp. CA1]